MQIILSPSKLNEFNACPRCFYDSYTLDLKKPRGIYPGLPMGMDKVLKEYASKCRGSLPSPLIGQVKGVLMEDAATLKKWQNWRSAPKYIDAENDIMLRGALDDCVTVQEKDMEYHVPFDWKTKGSKPKDDGSQYYQTQLDSYNLMLSANDYKILNIGYLAYVYPLTATSKGQMLDFTFGIDVYKLECNIERAKEIVRKAAECLRMEKRPESSSDCEYCPHIVNHLTRGKG